MGIRMIKDPVCGMELDEKAANIKAEVRGKTYYFCSEFCLSNFDPLGRISHRSLLDIVLSKAFFEAVAIGTGIAGILYTLQEVTVRALIMDTSSALAAIIAFVIGVEKFPILKEYKLVEKAVIWTGLAIITLVIILVWHFGFHS